jgi:hypothetical protein
LAGVHQRVAHALGQLHDDADVIVPKLIALIEQPANRYWGNSTREHAFEALSLLGPKAKAAVPRLRAMAESKTALADAAARVLEKIVGE